MKHSKLLFGLVAVLGAAFVTIFFAGLYLWSIGLENILTLLPNTQLGLCFVLFCLLGGTSLLTVGICGIERQARFLFSLKSPKSLGSFSFSNNYGDNQQRRHRDDERRQYCCSWEFWGLSVFRLAKYVADVDWVVLNLQAIPHWKTDSVNQRGQLVLHVEVLP